LEQRALPAQEKLDVSRRELLRNAAVAMVATVGLGTAWRLISGVDSGSGATSAPVAASGAPAAALAPNAPPFDLKGLSPEVTAVSDFYTVSKNFIDPAVAVGGWKLKIDGLVDAPMEFNYDQLKSLPAT